jgi:hypothetical protein
MAHSPAFFYYVLFFCAGAFILYQIDRAFSFSPEDRVNAPDRDNWSRSHRGYVAASLVGACVALVSALPHLPLPLLVVSAFVGLAGVLHALPAIGGVRRFKSFGALKSVAIVLAWIGGGVVIPLVLGPVDFRGGIPIIVFLVVYRTPVVTANLLAADYLDRAGDLSVGLESVGHTIEWSRLRHISLALLLFSVMSGILGTAYLGQAGPGWSLLAVDVVGHLAAAGVIARNSPVSRYRLLVLDLFVGWPAITYLVFSTATFI